MTTRGALAGAGLALIAGPVLAACPAGPEALDAGIVVRYDDGSVSTFRSGGDGSVVEQAVYNDPGSDVDADFFRTLFGIYEIEAIGMLNGVPVPDTVTRRTFDSAPGDLPRPEAGLIWTGGAKVTYGADPALSAEITVMAGAEQQVGFGDCTYDSLTVLVHEVDSESESTLIFDWLPDLGISVYRGISEAGGAPELYTPVAVEAVGGN